MSDSTPPPPPPRPPPARSKRAPAKTRASARNVGSATSGGSAEANNVEGETKGSKKAPAAAAPATPSAAASAAGNGNAKTGAAATSGHTLPGVASLTSPADGNNPFNWATGSLRTGPLSPAMLGGPSGSHFDPNTFRTGFTPDLSNFKTGLTPLGATASTSHHRVQTQPRSSLPLAPAVLACQLLAQRRPSLPIRSPH